jgi:bacteriocin biosynthesis cyclodehydratase domain-containing protein
VNAGKLLFLPSVQVVRGESNDALLYVSERLSHRLTGKSVEFLVTQLLPLLDGTRTRDEIHEALRERVGEAALDGLLAALTQRRLLRRIRSRDATSQVPAFIADLADDPGSVWRRVRTTPVTILGLSASTSDLWRAAFRDAGFETPPREAMHGSAEEALSSGFMIAVDEDESTQRDRLRELNALALSRQRPWLLVRFTRADEVWIGPLFAQDEACYECFLDRWRSNLHSLREAEQFIDWRTAHPAPGWTPYRPHVAQVASAVAYETARFLAGLEASPLASGVRILDTRSQESALHRLLRRPLCPACGRAASHRAVPWEEDSLRVEALGEM